MDIYSLWPPGALCRALQCGHLRLMVRLVYVVCTHLFFVLNVAGAAYIQGRLIVQQLQYLFVSIKMDVSLKKPTLLAQIFFLLNS